MTIALHGLPTQLTATPLPAGAPLLVTMHGIGGNERDLASAFQGFDGHAVVASPRGPLPHPPGNAWYRLIRVGFPDPGSFDAAIATLGGWLRALKALPGNAHRPVVLSGFSQGAIMALSYALLHPEEVDGVLAFSGYIPQLVLDAVPAGTSVTPAPRVWLTHGHRDGLFPFDRAVETAEQLRARGIEATFAPHESGHDIPPAALEAAAAWLAQTFPAK